MKLIGLMSLGCWALFGSFSAQAGGVLAGNPIRQDVEAIAVQLHDCEGFVTSIPVAVELHKAWSVETPIGEWCRVDLILEEPVISEEGEIVQIDLQPSDPLAAVHTFSGLLGDESLTVGLFQ